MKEGNILTPLINLNHSDCIKIGFMRDHETLNKKVEVKMVLKSKMGGRIKTQFSQL